MRVTKPGWRRSAPQAPDLGTEEHDASVPGRTTSAVELARTSAAIVIERVPGALRTLRAGVGGTTAALQRLPDSTLRWIAASSVGLGAGLRLAGAPRLVSAAGAAPALVMGAVIALRPTEPAIPAHEQAIPAHEQAEEPAGGIIDMSDEHTKGAISTAEGKVEEGLGKLTGDKEAQAHGKAKQVQGAAQKGLGDVQDAIREPTDKGKA